MRIIIKKILEIYLQYSKNFVYLQSKTEIHLNQEKIK